MFGDVTQTLLLSLMYSIFLLSLIRQTVSIKRCNLDQTRLILQYQYANSNYLSDSILSICYMYMPHFSLLAFVLFCDENNQKFVDFGIVFVEERQNIRSWNKYWIPPQAILFSEISPFFLFLLVSSDGVWHTRQHTHTHTHTHTLTKKKKIYYNIF